MEVYKTLMDMTFGINTHVDMLRTLFILLRCYLWITGRIMHLRLTIGTHSDQATNRS